MHQPGQLTIEDCWQPNGSLRIEASEDGARIRLRGNRDGYVGLARMLLFLAQHGIDADRVVALDEMGAFEDGGPVLDLTAHD